MARWPFRRHPPVPDLDERFSLDMTEEEAFRKLVATEGSTTDAESHQDDE